jgi:single-strand DNA-binding protein
MDTWDDKSTGEKRSKILVHADRVQFLESRRGESGSSSGDDDMASAPPPAREPGGRRTSPAPARRPGSATETRGPADSAGSATQQHDLAAGEDGVEEDIPF